MIEDEGNKKKNYPPGSSPASNNLGEDLTGLKRPKIAVFCKMWQSGDNKKAPYCHPLFSYYQLLIISVANVAINLRKHIHVRRESLFLKHPIKIR